MFTTRQVKQEDVAVQKLAYKRPRVGASCHVAALVPRPVSALILVGLDVTPHHRGSLNTSLGSRDAWLTLTPDPY